MPVDALSPRKCSTQYFFFFFLLFSHLHALQCRLHTYPDLTISGLPTMVDSASQTDASMSAHEPLGRGLNSHSHKAASRHAVTPCWAMPFSPALAHVLLPHSHVACFDGWWWMPEPEALTRVETMCYVLVSLSYKLSTSAHEPHSRRTLTFTSPASARARTYVCIGCNPPRPRGEYGPWHSEAGVEPLERILLRPAPECLPVRKHPPPPDSTSLALYRSCVATLHPGGRSASILAAG